MKTSGKRINIMSSCDETYAKLVPVQLLSIADNLFSPPLNYEVHYYLFYSRVSDETIEYLHKYCDAVGIVFHKVYIKETGLYKELASKGGAARGNGGWPYEAYFSVECHKYFPPEVDRVLYIDAADVLILGDIGEYYFDDFEDCTLIVTCARFRTDSIRGRIVFEKDDLGNEKRLSGILRGLFNSGSYVMNINKMRHDNLSLNDYIALKNALISIYPGKDEIYFGDQGLLSAAYVGDIKYFDYPAVKNLWYQPYNFCLWFFDKAAEKCGGNPWYLPRILHFTGAAKPWKLTTMENEKALKPGQWPFYKIYRVYEKNADKVFSNKFNPGL